MKVSIYYFGKKSDYSDIQNEYIKRLGAFCDISIVQMKPSSLKARNTIEEVMQEEAIELMKKWPEGHTTVMDRKGKEMSTKLFAQVINSLKDQGRNINFIIGGAYGVNQSVITKADLSMSLSQLTMPHELSKIVLLEQLYRVFTIIAGKKYHY